MTARSRPAFSRLWRYLAMIGVAAIVLAACGDDSTEPAAEPPEEPAAEEPAAEEPAAEEPAAEEPAAEEPAAEEPAAEEPDEPVELLSTSLAVTPNLNGGPIFVAAGTGIFLENGLDPDITVATSGGAAQAALAAGDADFVLSGVDTTLTGLEGGADVIGVTLVLNNNVVKLQDDQFAIVTNDPDITDLSDLEGQQIAVPGPPVFGQYANRVFEDQGVDAASIEFITVPNPAEGYAALEGGGIAAAVVNEPTASRVVLRLENGRELFRGGGFSGTRVLLISTPDYVAANPDAVLAVVRSLAQAAQVIRTDPEAAGVAFSGFIDGLEADVAQMALQSVSYDPRVGPLVLEGWDEENELLVADGVLSEPVDFEESFDASFIDTVEAENPEFFDDLEPL